MIPKNEDCDLILERVPNADELKIFLIFTGRVIVITENEDYDFKPNAERVERNNVMPSTVRLPKFFFCVPIK